MYIRINKDDDNMILNCVEIKKGNKYSFMEKLYFEFYKSILFRWYLYIVGNVLDLQKNKIKYGNIIV